MKRNIMKQLLAWKLQAKRKPLLLMGARQVGKTFTLKQFGAAEYENTIYLNFEDNPRLGKLFEASLDPEHILKALRIEVDAEIVPGKTLLIFDEVQESPSALNSLKYFCEKAPEQHICAAGSLLGVKLVHTKGFPVGKVNFMDLYPLSFMEYLEVLGELKLKSYLEELEGIQPLAPNLHVKLLQYFKEYLFIGGMPEAVAEYLDSNDFSKVRQIQEAVLNAYALDFAKHAPKDQVMKINQIWGSIPSQLAKENKKFIYSVIREGARAKEFEIALQWLVEAGLIYKVSNISVPKIPLEAYADPHIFKMYLVDVGLLGAMSHLSAKAILDEHQLFQEFRGALVENYIAQELVHDHKRLFYWSSEGKAELDFVFQQENAVYPLEVKSGNSGKKKSLRVYGDKYHPDLLLRASPINLKKDGDVLNCPLYLVSELRKILAKVSPIDYGKNKRTDEALWT